MLKKVIAAICFLGMTSFASAQATGVIQKESDTEKDQVFLLEKKTQRFCQYEDKRYSEGSLREVGKHVLICVEPRWGLHVSGEVRHLVWEPITSHRLSNLLDITGLKPSNSK